MNGSIMRGLLVYVCNINNHVMLFITRICGEGAEWENMARQSAGKRGARRAVRRLRDDLCCIWGLAVRSKS